jgi:spore germination cell wall hydrolase CwlJ-like protein|tara:strand:+ start:84 stop:635 length:552 start_codon:yes stop_codon:yes gene_type:complete
MSKVIFIIPTLLAILIVFLIFQLSSKAIQTEALVRADFKHNITFDQLIPKAQKQVMCLAENIFYESAHEPLDGQVAVAFVTLNRVKSKSYPNNICSVVKQKNPRGCQFSWYCEGKQPMEWLTRHNETMYNTIVKLAINVYANHDSLEDPSKGSLFYHANYVKPKWRRDMIKVAVIGKHIFYRK